MPEPTGRHRAAGYWFGRYVLGPAIGIAALALSLAVVVLAGRFILDALGIR